MMVRRWCCEGEVTGLIWALGLECNWIKSTDFWSRVIKNIYRADGGINDATSRRSGLSNWGAILSSMHNLKLKGTYLLSFCSRKIGNGASTRFWDDLWTDNQSLKSKYLRIFMLDNDRDCYVANRVPIPNWSSVLRRHPRKGAESSQFEALQADIGNVVLTDQCDTWQWLLDVSPGYSVASVRSLVDARTLEVDSNATRWIRCIPIKVNVFWWRLSLNRLPSRVILDRKGIDVGSLLCPICQEEVESVNHIFFSCEMAKALSGLLLSGGSWTFLFAIIFPSGSLGLTR
ncbi:RNA-directed DNA polymerase, eukaryota, reverse transcriptase zinc-binding domain protein [Tanacetum coccineum]